MYNTIQKFGVPIIFFKEINIFIRQAYTTLIKSDSKNIYNVTNVLLNLFKEFWKKMICTLLKNIMWDHVTLRTPNVWLKILQ